jgi:hypothetical protein
MGGKMTTHAAEKTRSSMTAEVRPSTLLVCLLVLLIFSSPALSASSDGLQVLKISPQDKTSVIRGNDGKLTLVKEGDSLDTKKFSVHSAPFAEKTKKNEKKHTLTVIEIAEGRVVLEEKQGDEGETIIFRLVDGKQKVERIRKIAPGKRQQLTAVSSQPSAGGGKEK